MTLIRLPGGSWSNSYDWLACEQGDADGCHWTWAARPSDFLQFVREVGAEAMWTVSPNLTAHHAAALVAFFNGDVADERPIGVDVRGRDWLTVGHWARLRAAGGSPEPLGITLWEFGNEVYGAKASVGPGCAEWGWEDVWTCDGREYVEGVGEGTERREGYLEYRAAMRAVDPEVQLGAVGVEQPGSWSNWGTKVIAGAGAVMDFYIVHHYAFNNPPPDPHEALARPQRTWPELVAGINAAFDEHAGGRRVPIAVTEYNLFAVRERDADQWMTRAVNALFLADSIGQMISSGVTIANQWNLANGKRPEVSDYGMVEAEGFARYPQYYVFPLWRRVGVELLPVTSPFAADVQLSLYAGRTAEGAITLLAINKTGRPLTTTVALAGLESRFDLSVDRLEADALLDGGLRVNGRADPPEELFSSPLETRRSLSAPVEQTFAPYSVTLLQMRPQP